jgi:hypothetical protein
LFVADNTHAGGAAGCQLRCEPQNAACAPLLAPAFALNPTPPMSLSMYSQQACAHVLHG